MRILIQLSSFVTGISLLILVGVLGMVRQKDAPAWIAYSIYYEGTYIVDENGNNRKFVGAGELPRWIPYSTDLIYSTSADYGSPTAIWRKNPFINTTPKFLIQNNFYNETSVISPDGKWIAFTAMYGMGEIGTFYISAQGSNLYHISSYEECFVWSPDSKWLAFTVENTLYRLQPTSNIPAHPRSMTLPLPVPPEAQLLTTIEENERFSTVSWHPDGRWIFFLAGNYEETKLYHYDLESRQLELLVDGIRGDFSFSPDGKQILYSDDAHIYMMDFQTKQRNILVTQTEIYPLVWFTDWIVLVSDFYEGGRILYRIKADGTHMEQVTDLRIANDMNNVTWTKEGKWIVIPTDYDGSLYKIEIETGKAHLIAKRAGGFTDAEAKDFDYQFNSQRIFFLSIGLLLTAGLMTVVRA